MAKGESSIVRKQQSQSKDVIFVDNTDSDGYSLNDCKKAAAVMMMIMMMMMMMMMIELLLLLHTPPL